MCSCEILPFLKPTITATAISTRFPVAGMPGSSQSIVGVGKVDRDFIHHLIRTNGARYIRHRYVWWEELADQMIPVEGLHASVANTTSHRWDRIEMRIVAHCRHRGL